MVHHKGFSTVAGGPPTFSRNLLYTLIILWLSTNYSYSIGFSVSLNMSAKSKNSKAKILNSGNSENFSTPMEQSVEELEREFLEDTGAASAAPVSSSSIEHTGTAQEGMPVRAQMLEIDARIQLLDFFNVQPKITARGCYLTLSKGHLIKTQLELNSRLKAVCMLMGDQAGELTGETLHGHINWQQLEWDAKCNHMSSIKIGGNLIAYRIPLLTELIVNRLTIFVDKTGKYKDERAFFHFTEAEGKPIETEHRMASIIIPNVGETVEMMQVAMCSLLYTAHKYRGEGELTPEVFIFQNQLSIGQNTRNCNMLVVVTKAPMTFEHGIINRTHAENRNKILDSMRDQFGRPATHGSRVRLNGVTYWVLTEMSHEHFCTPIVTSSGTPPVSTDKPGKVLELSNCHLSWQHLVTALVNTTDTSSVTYIIQVLDEVTLRSTYTVFYNDPTFGENAIFYRARFLTGDPTEDQNLEDRYHPTRFNLREFPGVWSYLNSQGWLHEKMLRRAAGKETVDADSDEIQSLYQQHFANPAKSEWEREKAAFFGKSGGGAGQSGTGAGGGKAGAKTTVRGVGKSNTTWPSTFTPASRTPRQMYDPHTPNTMNTPHASVSYRNTTQAPSALSLRTSNAAMEHAMQAVEDRVITRLAPAFAQASADRARLENTEALLQRLAAGQEMLMQFMQRGGTPAPPIHTGTDGTRKRDADTAAAGGSGMQIQPAEDPEI